MDGISKGKLFSVFKGFRAELTRCLNELPIKKFVSNFARIFSILIGCWIAMETCDQSQFVFSAGDLNFLTFNALFRHDCLVTVKSLIAITGKRKTDANDA